MIVIADTTPLNHLILIGLQDILAELYGRVIIPQAVLEELQAKQAPKAVGEWIAKRHPWLQVEHVTVPHDLPLEALDPGEREVIALAEEERADLLIMDDRGGRREALRRHLEVAGTLTVLYAAAQRGLVEDFPQTIERLKETGFRASPKLYQSFLDRHASGRKSC